MTQTQQTPRRKTTKTAVLVLAATAAIGFAGYQAIAETKSGRHIVAAAQHGGWSGMRGSFADMTDAEVDKKVERFVAHAAIEIDATDEQRDQIAAIAKAAVKDIRPLQQAMRADGKALKAILLSDTVDQTAVETIRAERLADFDAKSKVVTTALAEIAMVLTPEQRIKLDERISNFRKHRKGHKGHRN